MKFVHLHSRLLVPALDIQFLSVGMKKPRADPWRGGLSALLMSQTTGRVGGWDEEEQEVRMKQSREGEGGDY